MKHPKGKTSPCPAQHPPRPVHETVPMMINDISHLFFGRVRALEPTGVMSQHSARVLLRILAAQDGIKQSELAATAHLSAPSVSATLRRMESEGLIERRGDARDGRAIGVYLTERGRSQDRAARSLLHRVDAQMMQGISEQQKAQLSALLERIRCNLTQPETAGEGENT